MTCRLLLLAVTLIGSVTARSQTTFGTLVAGAQTFTNVVVLGHNATDLYFTHPAGLANVKLKHLSPELQAQFHFDPVLAAETERRQAEADARFTEELGRRIEAEARRNSPAAQAARSWAELGLVDPLDDASLLHQPAPEIKVAKWLGPKPEVKGRLTLLVFWSPGSHASRAVLPQVNAWQKGYADKLLILGVAAETERDVAQFADPRPEFLNGSDPENKLTTVMAVRTLPCAFLIDPQGYVRFQGHPAALDDKKWQAVFAHAGE